jgi:glycosyltransferase involved in cell wall biosynthesis
MISVLHVIDTGGPGGAETIFLHCATRLDPARFAATAVVDNDNWLAEQLRARGLEPLIETARGSFNLGYLRRLAAIARCVKANVICAHLYGSAIYASALGMVTGIPVISVFHGGADIAAHDRFTGLKAAIIRHGSRRVVFVSESLREQLHGLLKIPACRSTIIPNGIDTAAFSPGRDDSIRNALQLPADAILVGAIGNIRPAKSYDNLMRAARLLLERSDRFRFVIAGQNGGTLADDLLRLRAQLGLEERVFFLGLRADVATVLHNLDVFVLSSSSEGFSIACVEAMACAIPVVATRCGGPEEILDARSGILVAPEHPGALADAIHRIAQSPERARALSQAALARARGEFSLTTMLSRYESLIETVVNSGSLGTAAAL